jgi:hypothetical protein
VNLALLLVLAAAPAPQSWQFETSTRPTVSVSNVNGSVRVEATDGNTVSVEAKQEGSEERLARSPLEVKKDGDEITVRLCCGGSCSEKSNNCKDPATTHFVLKVPRSTSLEVSVVNAEVKTSGIAGPQDVSVVNGSVSLKGSRGDVEVSAVNGDVELAPEASVSGRFNGREVTFGSTEQRYGNGEHDVDVSTVSGSLDVQSE